MAVAAAAGAFMARPVPLWTPIAVLVLAAVNRRPLVVCAGVALLASGLAARSWSGIRPPHIGSWSGVATLVGDPSESSGAVRVDVRIDGKRVEAWARGRAAQAVAPRLAGEVIRISGRIDKVPPPARLRLARRHVGARLALKQVLSWHEGNVASRLANNLRRTLMAGTVSLPGDKRALFSGFVLGDDRHQAPEVVDDFRASGLAHLLVVSGENVAFLLALAGPLLRRLGLRGRLCTGVLLLAVFGVLTRWEPSVLRAEAMAALALVAFTIGRPASTLRLLALAVTAVLLVDPLLVGSLGFLLSVSACGGIALLARPFSEALPGPRPLAAALGVTLAAQVGVAPVLIPVFGSLPLAAVPANLLAVPAAGPVMMWGVAAGVPAGVVGGWPARMLHLPTGLLVGWVEAVARHAAGAPLGQLHLPHVFGLASALGAAALARRRHRPVAATVGLILAAVVLAAPLVGIARPNDLEGWSPTPGARVWRRAGATVVVVSRPPGNHGPPKALSGPALLRALHSRDIYRLDVLVVGDESRPAAQAIEPVLRRFPPRMLLTSSEHRLAGAVAAVPGARIAVGELSVVVETANPALRVRVVQTGRGPASH